MVSHICSTLKSKSLSFLEVVLSLLIFAGAINGQVLKPTKMFPVKLDANSNFFEIQKAMNEYWDSKMIEPNGLYSPNGLNIISRKTSKIPNYNIYKRWEYYWEQRINLETGKFPETSAVEEYQRSILKKSSPDQVASYNESWSNLGTNSSSGGYAGIGRINCIAFHPSDANTFWVGSPSGGIWATTDGGSTWTVLNDDESVLGVSSIVISSNYASDNTMYIATGDRDGGSMWSLSGGQSADNNTTGVYKSTDGGSNWSATGLTYAVSSGTRITKLLIHPSDNSILFASAWDGNSSNSGIYKSTDSGSSWSKKTSNLWMDIEFKPGDPTVMYASSYGYSGTYINRSTDTGDNWSTVNSGSPVAANGRRGELAVSSANSSYAYLLAANSSGGIEGIYKSTDNGVTWANAWSSGSPSGMCGYYTDGSGGDGGQGSYDLCIAVDPSDVDVVYIGGITTWKSSDGGVTWSALNNWTSSSTYNKTSVPVVHADKHALEFQSSSVLFEGNDGGIYKTTNGGSNWTDLSNGLVISQIYRLGVSQTSSTTVITGLQDNGSKLFSSGSWTDVTGGDGMECIVDYNDANYQYATYVRGEIYATSNNWGSYSTISANITGGQPTGAWVTPYIIDQNDNQTLYAGYDVVWKTTNRGSSWSSVSQTLSSSDKLRSLAIAPSNSSYLYSADPSNMWKTTDGGATNWSTITLPTTSNYLTYIAVKDDDPSTVWITYGGYTSGEKVYKSSDGGSSWTNISTGLPNLPVMCVIQYKDITSQEVLFAGTDVGVYVKVGDNDWASYNTNLPNVVVTELEIYYSDSTDKLRAATYGRGLWETDIDAGPLPVELIYFTSEITEDAVQLNWETATEINNYGFEVQRASVKVGEENYWETIGFVDGSGNSNSPEFYSFIDQNPPNEQLEYRLKQIDTDGQFQYLNTIIRIDGTAFFTSIQDGNLPEKFSLKQNYPNPFNPTTNISYSVAEKSMVKLEVYNSLGQIVRILTTEINGPGFKHVNFDGTDLTSGIYYVRLSVESLESSFTANRSIKMMLLK